MLLDIEMCLCRLPFRTNRVKFVQREDGVKQRRNQPVRHVTHDDPVHIEIIPPVGLPLLGVIPHMLPGGNELGDVLIGQAHHGILDPRHFQERPHLGQLLHRQSLGQR